MHSWYVVSFLNKWAFWKLLEVQTHKEDFVFLNGIGFEYKD